jgi:release factor glutamine methyltransferase
MQANTFNNEKIGALLARAASTLAAGPHAGRARRDAETLLLFALRQNDPNKNRAWLIAHEGDVPAAEETTLFHKLIERRRAGEPVQYIGGEAEFYGLPFTVNESVLIPRPETEHLVEKALALAECFERPRMVDVGTGSGAIAIALAYEWLDAAVTATDCSAQALNVARANAERNGVAARVRFFEGDLLAPVAGELFEIVVSNPPYVPARDRETLAVEVREFEPGLALFAGDDGLDIYRRLILAAREVLVEGGYIALEIGYGQRESIAALLKDAGFEEIEFTADLQGIPRVASAKRK